MNEIKKYLYIGFSIIIVFVLGFGSGYLYNSGSIDNFEEEYRTAQDRITTLEGQLESSQSILRSLRLENNRIREQIKRLEENNREYERIFGELREENNRLREAIGASEIAVGSIDQRLEELENFLRQLEEKAAKN